MAWQGVDAKRPDVPAGPFHRSLDLSYQMETRSSGAR